VKNQQGKKEMIKFSECLMRHPTRCLVKHFTLLLYGIYDEHQHLFRGVTSKKLIHLHLLCCVLRLCRPQIGLSCSA
jgi:hypothetical protein